MLKTLISITLTQSSLPETCGVLYQQVLNFSTAHFPATIRPRGRHVSFESPSTAKLPEAAPHVEQEPATPLPGAAAAATDPEAGNSQDAGKTPHRAPRPTPRARVWWDAYAADAPPAEGALGICALNPPPSPNRPAQAADGTQALPAAQAPLNQAAVDSTSAGLNPKALEAPLALAHPGQAEVGSPGAGLEPKTLGAAPGKREMEAMASFLANLLHSTFPDGFPAAASQGAATAAAAAAPGAPIRDLAVEDSMTAEDSMAAIEAAAATPGVVNDGCGLFRVLCVAALCVAVKSGLP